MVLGCATMDVGDFLRKLGLEQYAAAFRENDIGADLLPTLSDDDLKELGIASLGHRRRLLQVLAALRSGAEAAPPAVDAKPTAHPEAERRQDLSAAMRARLLLRRRRILRS